MPQAKYATCCLLSYNRPEFVREAITTLIGNARYPLELIVHDDGSNNEEVRSLLRSFVDSGAISTLIENPPGWDQGQGVALNRMFHMASGDPIIKLDHDLIFMPGWLRQVVTVLERNELPTQPRLGALGLFKYHAEPVVFEKTVRKAHHDWYEVDDFVGSAIVVPRSVWEEFGPFSEHSDAFAEDYEFKVKVQEAGLALGLTAQDVAVNQGFGVGPSTLVEGWDDDKNEGILAKIHHGPRVVEITR